MKCELVHEIAGRARIRFDSPYLFNGQIDRLAHCLQEQRGVRHVRLSPSTQSAVITYDPALASGSRLLRQIRRQSLPSRNGHSSHNGQLRKQQPAGDGSWLPPWTPLALSSLAMALGAVSQAALVPWVVAGASVPIVKRAIDSLWRRRRLNVDVLDASALAVLLSQGQFLTGGFMVWLVSVGDYLREYTRQHSVRAIKSLYGQKTVNAWVVRGNRKLRVDAEKLRRNQRIVVYPGELVPADGIVVKGEAQVDQKLLTGESMPVVKRPGTEVFAGTVVADGKVYVNVRKTGQYTKAAEIVRLILDTPVGDTRIQDYAEQFADRLVPYSFAGAGAVMLVGGQWNMAASLLIVDFGTGIRVAAPTSVLASIAGAAREGILVKGGRHLETLARTDAFVFDKTGTLTTGVAQVLDIIPYHRARQVRGVLAMAAAAEARFTHPVAQAIMAAARHRGLVVPQRQSSHYTIGMGVEAMVGQAQVLVGNEAFMLRHDVRIGPAAGDVRRATQQGASSLFVAIDGCLEVLIVYSDPLRPEAADVMLALRAKGVKDLVLLTGDNAGVAGAIAQAAGVDRFVANAFPDQKVEVVEALQKEGRTVAVVGDGINDSPALARADIGIAVHNGTDVAQQTAHVALLDESLWKIPQAIDLARSSVDLIRQNWSINFYPNCAAIGLTLLGLLGPVGATLVSNGAAVAATLNALRPLAGGRVRL